MYREGWNEVELRPAKPIKFPSLFLVQEEEEKEFEVSCFWQRGGSGNGGDAEYNERTGPIDDMCVAVAGLRSVRAVAAA